MEHKKSEKLWKKAQASMPGGVNSPVRAFKSVEGSPIVIKLGKKCYLYDVDKNKYLDFVNAWGPLILGHANKELTETLIKQVSKGVCYGSITPYEIELATLITKHIPHVEKIRFLNSGTEAVMTAIRLARGITKKDKIVKFDGCYHGHVDAMLVKSGSGLITEADESSTSDGLTMSSLQDTIVLPLNDEEALEQCFIKYGDQIAAAIIEPLPANSGLLPQRLSFLSRIKELCTQYKSLFILDEVITGFRLGFGGFSSKYNLIPDLVTYGKIIGGGMPIGAVGGKKEYLSQLAPEGKIYQAGTFCGNPMAMQAGLTTLNTLLSKDVHIHLKYLGTILTNLFMKEINPLLAKKDYHIQLVQEESIFWLNFSPKNDNTIVRKVDKIWEGSAAKYKDIFNYMLSHNIYMAPSAYEVGFLSYPMKKKHIEQFVATLKAFLINEQ